MNNLGATTPVRSTVILWFGWCLLGGVFTVGAVLVGDIYTPAAEDFRLSSIEIRPIEAWQFIYAVGFVGYVVLLWAFRRNPPKPHTLLFSAILLRVILLLSPPNSDCNRYIWEGRIQGEGYSPYVYAPQDEVLEHLRDDVYEGINKKHYSTIYPPLSELAFRLLAHIHYSVKSPQVFHTILDVGVVLALAALLSALGQPNWYLAIYALCPMVLASFAHAGHNDTLMILGILGFVAAGRKRSWGWAGFALGLAVLAKTTPAILFALLLRRSRRAIGVGLATIACGYLLYVDAGTDLFKVLKQFPSQDGPFNNIFDELRIGFRKLGGPALLLSDRNLIAIALLAGLTAYRVWRPRDLLQDAKWLLVIVVLMLPIIHFWYLTWPLALITLRPKGHWSWVILTGTMVMYWYADWAWQSGLRWQLPAWAVCIIWIPFFVAWIAETLWVRRGDRRQAASA